MVATTLAFSWISDQSMSSGSFVRGDGCLQRGVWRANGRTPAEFRRRYNQTRDRADALQTQLTATEAALSTLQGQLDATSAALITSQGQRDAYTAGWTRLHGELGAARAEIVSLTTQLATTQERLSSTLRQSLFARGLGTPASAAIPATAGAAPNPSVQNRLATLFVAPASKRAPPLLRVYGPRVQPTGPPSGTPPAGGRSRSRSPVRDALDWIAIGTDEESELE